LRRMTMETVNRRQIMQLAATAGAVSTGVVLVGGTAKADERVSLERPERSDIFKMMLANREIRGPLAMANGATSGSLTVQTSLPGQSRTRDADWAFEVPPGFVRYSANFQTDHHGGDVAQCGWANDNPADGTVHAHVHASQANGYARAAVDSVYA